MTPYKQLDFLSRAPRLKKNRLFPDILKMWPNIGKTQEDHHLKIRLNETVRKAFFKTELYPCIACLLPFLCLQKLTCNKFLRLF